jgi:hypothetical protein
MSPTVPPSCARAEGGTSVQEDVRLAEPTHLDNAHIRLLARLIHRHGGNALNPILHGVGQVRNDLDRLAEVVAPALLFNHVRVDLAGRDVVVAREGDVEVALVVAEVEIGFAAVVEDVDLAWGCGGMSVIA